MMDEQETTEVPHHQVNRPEHNPLNRKARRIEQSKIRRQRKK